MSMSSVWRAAALAVLIAVPGVALTGTAHAAGVSVWVASGELVVKAGGAQVNKVQVTHAGDLLVVTDAVPIGAGPGCRNYKQTEVHCPAAGVTSLWVDLGDLGDSFWYKGSLPGVFDGGAGGDVLSGGSGSDKVMGGDGDDYVYGNAGDDAVYGGVGADRVYGGAGNDVMYGDLSVASPLCASGTDISCYDHLYGGDGADKVYGGEWGDLLAGEAGNDLLRDFSGGGAFIGGTGNDSMIGAGPSMRDTVDYSDHAIAVKVDLGLGTGGQLGEADTIREIQDVQGGAGNDVLIGNSGNNRIEGLGGALDQADGADGQDKCFTETQLHCE